MKIYDPNIPFKEIRETAIPVSGSKSPGRQDEAELLKLRKACRDFESIFISYMLKSMQKASEKSTLFGQGLGSDMYEELFNEKLAEEMANSGQMKIGDVLFNQYSKMIEKQPAAETTPAKPDFKPIRTIKSFDVNAAADKTRAVVNKPQASKPAEKPAVTAKKETGLLAKFEDVISDAAEKFGLEPGLLRAVIKHESGGNPKAVSPRGAKGLMQLVDSTAKMLGVDDPFNPIDNIMGGAKYLSQLMKRFGGDVKMALASYNAGPGAVEKYNGIPPYAETRNYVRKIMATYNEENLSS